MKLFDLETTSNLLSGLIRLEAMKIYLSALGMNLIDCLHGVQVVDTRVKTNFVHDNDTSGFYSIL
jgi:hypothetical protein